MNKSVAQQLCHEPEQMMDRQIEQMTHKMMSQMH